MEAGRPKEGVEKIPQDNEGKARDQAAAQVGVNPRYVSDAKKIKEADSSSAFSVNTHYLESKTPAAESTGRAL